MKIIGVGTDIVNIRRIENICKKNKHLFLKKIFTNKEIKILTKYKFKQGSKIAMRFAAKEALSKALGTGIGKKLSFLDFEVLNLSSGQPYFFFKNKQIFKNLNSYLSMSDDYPWALAFVVITK